MGLKVRAGGRLTPQGFLFELSGGNLGLDFANTVDKRPTSQPVELLRSFADLVSWARQAGALLGPEAARLTREASRHPREVLSVLDKARALREALFHAFAAAAAGRHVPKAALETLNPAMAQAFARLRLLPGDGRGARWAWADDRALDRMLWPVLRAAASLLTGDELPRVRECAADDCGWLFLDRSKNRSRRWCDMTVCGNRDKVRRHRARQRRA